MAASIHAAVAAAAASLKTLLPALSAEQLQRSELRLGDLLRAAMHVFDLMKRVQDRPGTASLRGAFWRGAQENQTLATLVLVLGLSGFTDFRRERHCEMAERMSNALRISGDRASEPKLRELAEHWHSILQSSPLQQYAVDSLSMLGAEGLAESMFLGARLGGFFPLVVGGFTDFLLNAALDKAIPADRLGALITSDGLRVHLEGFAAGRPGFKANKPTEIMAIIFEGLKLLEDRDFPAVAAECAAHEPLQRALLAVARQASALLQLHALPEGQRPRAKRRALKHGFLQLQVRYVNSIHRAYAQYS